MADHYVQPHVYQYAQANSLATRRSGCTWVSLANGIGAITGGRYRPTPDKLHDLVPRTQETSPATPGWSIADARLAAQRYGAVRLEDRSGQGWAGVRAALDAGQYVLLQGDSDRFTDATCSGAFDGDHCIGISPNVRALAGHRQYLMDDPVCPDHRWEDESRLRAYAEKLSSSIRFGVFTQKVPELTWQWRAPRLSYVEYTGIDRASGTYDGRHRERSSAWRSQAYRGSEPASFRGPHGPRRLVQIGNLVKGGTGKYTGQWVLAENAHEVVG